MPKKANCATLIATGSCNNVGCRANHNITTCDVCQIVITTTYDIHCQTAKHLTKAARTTVENPHGWIYCSICERLVVAAIQWRYHKKSKRHMALAEEQGISPKCKPVYNIPETVFEKHTFCAVCETYVHLERQDIHFNGKIHKKREDFASFKMVQEEMEQDKNDVEIRGDLNFGVIEPSIIANGGATKRLQVRSTTPLAKITLVSAGKSSDLGFQKNRIKSPFTITIEGSHRNLKPSTPIQIAVTFQEEHIGRYQDRVEIRFHDPLLNKDFMVAKSAQVIVGDPSLHDQMKPKSMYIPRVRAPREPEIRVVGGIQPPSLEAIPYIGKLEKAAIPERLVAALTVSSTASSRNVQEMERVFLPKNIGSESLGQHLKTLLWIEEFKMEQDLESYDMAEAALTKNLPYYHLEVPGLAEKRPSVLVGDRILVRLSNGTHGHWFEGHVHFIHQYEVGLRFHGSFRGWSRSNKYHIRFKLNRIPLQRQHKALSTVFTEGRILFPESSHLPMRLIPTPNLTPYNHLLSTNTAQLQAVASILDAEPGSLPFIVFGPPGTGKTVTIVEAIMQLLNKDPSFKILACAPSNSAADLIALRLRDMLNKDEMFRMYAPSRNRNQVPDDLDPYIYYRDNGVSRPCFSVPPMAVMKQYRVIVTTCISASIVSGIGMARGHFSHIFIDEAGQATEPEVLLSIKMMADPATNVVLSGDPKQLGPIIRSGLASRLGLEVSYLERLMERPPYELAVGYGKSIVKLVKNFRSHDAILRFPNERFYDGDLRACGFTKNINAYLGSSYLPKRTFPIVFHAVYGKDDRESTSPSFFNVDEITQVRLYIERLKADRIYNTRDEDIGVITPYHAQCQKIRKVLRGRADEVKVGSVEEFQGQERSIIIISTVRSSREYVAYDIRHTLGFVASPRRFNVAVTRARALLIIIGDPEVLGIDPLWRSFLNYIHNNGGWKGPDIPWDPSATVDETMDYATGIRESATLDMNEFTRRMENMTLGEMEGEDLDAGVDKPWRDME